MKVNWGINAADVDDYDRDSQYRPYDGPLPANGVYVWKVKKLQFVAGTGQKHPQLRIGMELHPRNKAENRFKGYYLMNFIPIMPKTQFRYVPFLDALGVSGREFETGTLADEEGNIKKIGKWRNTNEALIKGELKDDTGMEGEPRKAIGWMGAFDPDTQQADDDDAEEDEYDADDYDAEDHAEDGDADDDDW